MYAIRSYYGKLCHTEVFDTGNPLAERNTRWAIVLTVITMIVEIAGGWIFNSYNFV